MVAKRSSNIELYRIIVMLLIVAHHYVVNSGLLDTLNAEPFATRPLFFYVFGMWGKIGINCFVLITGFFMCHSTITFRKFIKLILEVVFYNIAIYIVFVLQNYEEPSLISLLKKIWLFGKVADSFTTCFILFFLFIPFLNVLVLNLERKKHLWLIVLCLSIYTIGGSMPKIKIVMNYLTWFFVLYLISSYIRFYKPHLLDKLSSIGGVIIFLLLTIASVVFMRYISIMTGLELHYYFVVDVNKIFAVLFSVILFNFFRNINLSYNKWINMIASSTFGVYLIHTNSDAVRKWLWYDMIDCVGHYNSVHYMSYAILSVFVIFFVCVIIDQIRIWTIEKWFFIFYDRIISPKISKQNEQQ